jgi:hypothetical protein
MQRVLDAPYRSTTSEILINLMTILKVTRADITAEYLANLKTPEGHSLWDAPAKGYGNQLNYVEYFMKRDRLDVPDPEPTVEPPQAQARQEAAQALAAQQESDRAAQAAKEAAQALARQQEAAQEPETPPQATEPPVMDPWAAASAFGDAVRVVQGAAKDLWDAHNHHHRNKGAERPFSLVTAYKAAWQAAVNLWPFEGRATSSADIDQARETSFGRFALIWMDILHPDRADQEIENRVVRSISDEEKRRGDEAAKKERLRRAEIEQANKPKPSPYDDYSGPSR